MSDILLQYQQGIKPSCSFIIPVSRKWTLANHGSMSSTTKHKQGKVQKKRGMKKIPKQVQSTIITYNCKHKCGKHLSEYFSQPSNRRCFSPGAYDFLVTGSFLRFQYCMQISPWEPGEVNKTDSIQTPSPHYCTGWHISSTSNRSMQDTQLSRTSELNSLGELTHREETLPTHYQLCFFKPCNQSKHTTSSGTESTIQFWHVSNNNSNSLIVLEASRTPVANNSQGGNPLLALGFPVNHLWRLGASTSTFCVLTSITGTGYYKPFQSPQVNITCALPN